MSEKISTIIIKVDLECCRCYKKIKKTLCKLQDRQNIQSIVYDVKNNSVTIKGPFDPKKLIKKLCCMACKVIKDIQIVEDKPSPKPADSPPPPPPEKKPEPPPPAPEPAKPAPKPEPPAAPAPPAPKPEPPAAPAPPPPAPEPKPEPVKKPDQPKPEPVAKPPQPACPYPVPVWTSGPICCCRPWLEAYYGGCRCCSCGWVGGPTGGGPPVVYGGPPCYDGPKTCQFICEEDPSCRIM